MRPKSISGRPFSWRGAAPTSPHHQLLRQQPCQPVSGVGHWRQPIFGAISHVRTTRTLTVPSIYREFSTEVIHTVIHRP